MNRLAGRDQGHVRLHFEPHERISVTVELPSGQQVTAELAAISLGELCLRLSTPPDDEDLNGEWLVHFPTLQSDADSLRFRVTSHVLGVMIRLSTTPSCDEVEHEDNRRFMRAALVSLHQVQMAQWLLRRQRISKR